jgi:hypothetical protein
VPLAPLAPLPPPPPLLSLPPISSAPGGATRGGGRVGELPCGHVFHRSEALPAVEQLPENLEIEGHSCVKVRWTG